MLLDLTRDFRQTRTDKLDIIRRFSDRIVENEAILAQVQSDKYLDEKTKEKKIKHIQSIIDGDKFSIRQATQYLAMLNEKEHKR